MLRSKAGLLLTRRSDTIRDGKDPMDQHAALHLDTLVVVPCTHSKTAGSQQTETVSAICLPGKMAANARHAHGFGTKVRTPGSRTLCIEDVVALVSLPQRQDVADDCLRPELALLLPRNASIWKWNR